MEATAVLVVDDETDFSDLLAARLTKRGFTVTNAADGSTALQTLATDASLAVVVLDLSMPGMDGIETLRAIKKHHPLIEVIMLTGKGTVHTAVEAIKWGAYNYLIKPCDIEDLGTFIHDAAQHRRHRQARILEVRMTPYLSAEKREEMIATILRE